MNQVKNLLPIGASQHRIGGPGVAKIEAMIDRIEEYRRDWVAGPVPKPKKIRIRFPHLRWKIWRWVSLALALFSGVALATLHRPFKLWIDNQVLQMKTGLEMTMMMRELRRYYLTHASLPPSPEGFLRDRPSKANPNPPGYDYWGRPYRFEHDWQGFWLRSAGANGLAGDGDDLVQTVWYRDLKLD